MIAQKTEEILGPYELHDFFLYYFVKYGLPPEKQRNMHALLFPILHRNLSGKNASCFSAAWPEGSSNAAVRRIPPLSRR